MQIVFLAELNAYDPFNDELVTLRICEGGHGPVVYGDTTYLPCLTKRNTYSLILSDNGDTSEPSISYGSLGIRIHSDFDNLPWHDYDFDGYPCSIMWGEYGAPLDTFKPWPSGRTGQANSVKPTIMEIDVSGPDSELQKEILTAEFKGTGASEGAEDHKGVLKPFVVGGVENISADPVDTVYQVYQYHGYGPTEGVRAVYENALTLGEPYRRVNTYEELIGLALPDGTWAHAPAVGMYRLANVPTGKHTADVWGALDENGETMRTFGKIAPWMLHTIAGVSKADINYDSFDKLDRDFPHTWGNYINSQDKPEDENEVAISVGDFLREAADQLGAYIMPDENGRFFAGRVTSDKEPTTLHQFGVAGPTIINDSISKEYGAKRAYKVRVGGRRAFELHNDDEISSALKDAIEEVAVGVGVAVKDIADDVNALRGNFRDLAKETLLEDIADIEASRLEYGAAQFKATQALHKQNQIAISAIGIRVDENGSLVAEQITNLTTRVGEGEDAVEAGFLEVNRTIASEVGAAVEQFQAGIANYKDEVSAAFTEERRVRAEKDSALAEESRALEVRVGGAETRLGGIDGQLVDANDRILIAEGKIEETNRLVLDFDSGTAESIRQIGIKITDETTTREGAVRDVVNVVNEQGRVLSQRIEEVGSSIGDNSEIMAAIQRIDETEVTNNGARAHEISTMKARLDNTNGASYEQQVQLIANVNGTISSTWTTKVATIVDGVHYIGGIGIVNQNGYVQTAFMTDTLSVYTPNGKQQLFYLDGEGAVLNSLTASKLRVTQGQITNLLVDTLQVAGNAITANTFHTAGDAYCPAGGTIDFMNTGFFNIGDAYDGSAVVSVNFTIDATAYYDAASFIELFLDNGSGYRSVASGTIGISTNNGNTYWRTSAMLIGGIDGANVRVLARINSGTHTPRSVSRSFYVRNIAMTIIGAKR